MIFIKPTTNNTNTKHFILIISLFTLINCSKKHHDEQLVAATSYQFILPNKEEVISTSKDSVEQYIVKWLQDDSKIVNKTTWFNFDCLVFDEGKTKLNEPGQLQLKNIKKIMDAFPKMELKIGAYTDSLEVNKEKKMSISESRANNVKLNLIALGIDSTRLQSEGYGDQYPVASNKIASGRAENRRVAVRITKK